MTVVHKSIAYMSILVIACRKAVLSTFPIFFYENKSFFITRTFDDSLWQVIKECTSDFLSFICRDSPASCISIQVNIPLVLVLRTPYCYRLRSFGNQFIVFTHSCELWEQVHWNIQIHHVCRYLVFKQLINLVVLFRNVNINKGVLRLQMSHLFVDASYLPETIHELSELVLAVILA